MPDLCLCGWSSSCALLTAARSSTPHWFSRRLSLCYETKDVKFPTLFRNINSGRLWQPWTGTRCCSPGRQDPGGGRVRRPGAVAIRLVVVVQPGPVAGPAASIITPNPIVTVPGLCSKREGRAPIYARNTPPEVGKLCPFLLRDERMGTHPLRSRASPLSSNLRSPSRQGLFSPQKSCIPCII